MRTDIITAIKGLAKIFDKEINHDLNTIWLRCLSELSPDELARAVREYVLNPKNEFFPKPGQIYGLARPQANKEEEASIIADNIFACVQLYGSDTVGIERTRAKVGEIGWAYIANMGGWCKFQSSITDMGDIPILKSQARKSIMGLIQRMRNDIPLAQESHITLESLGVVMKQLE